MADPAVDFLLENLQRLRIYHSNLIGDIAKDQILTLEENLRLIRAFLRNSTKKRREDDSLSKLVRHIRDIVYDAEDRIDAEVSHAAESKSKNYFPSVFRRSENVSGIAKCVESIGHKVRDIYGNMSNIDFAGVHISDDESDPKFVRLLPVGRENVVGFEDDVEKLIGYLTEETDELDVISIIGMPGLGKTTLAAKVFHDPRMVYKFRTRIWVCVSQDFSRKNVLLAILKEFTSLTADVYGKKDEELAQLVASYLGRGQFLIVMDDVWTAEDWDAIRHALPKSNEMGKVLITSRHMEVGRYTNRNRPPFKLRFLNPEESWLLLQLEVFGTPECPPVLEVLGKQIADQCYGLPLAIKLVAGFLTEKISDWRKVSENVSTYLNVAPERYNLMENIISLGYDGLPDHLRTCFLYMGMFSEDFEIPAWKLIRLWIAEGFVQEKSGLKQEEIAESFLEDLINRNLVRVEKRYLDGRVKTCRIHDEVRRFCLAEAGREGENFFQEMKSTGGRFERPFSYVENYRRLCIHSDVLDFISSKPYGPRVRSFLCFSKDEIILPTQNTKDIPESFKLLRVLDVNPIKFNKIPSELYHLVHLRHVALSFINVAILPAAFSKFWNIETLIFDTTSRTLEIKADIWEMIHLRHLKTNASATLLEKGNYNKRCEKLQTLGTISPESCTAEVLYRARNLEKLAVCGRLPLLLGGNNGSFDSFQILDNLENLKLINDLFSCTLSEGQLHGLPPPYKFPPKLRSLTLSDTFLDWSHMSILGMLYNLEILKLKHKAFMGENWETTDGGFLHLEVLHIGRTDLVSWVASAHHFPRLRCLQLRNCEELHELPLGLADIPSLQLLDLHRCKSAAASAKRICEAIRWMQKERPARISGFKLSIFPPED